MVHNTICWKSMCTFKAIDRVAPFLDFTAPP
jgi:hypothetical protein